MKWRLKRRIGEAWELWTPDDYYFASYVFKDYQFPLGWDSVVSVVCYIVKRDQ